jgi:N-methylhydantoinase A
LPCAARIGYDSAHYSQQHSTQDQLMIAGVDIGGTFTDLVLSADGRLTIHKLLSTPDDPSRAMLAGLATLTAGRAGALARVAHGSTVATNAILERKGARIAFIATAGFRDLLFIGRQNRPPSQLYALHPQLPPPLVARELCFDLPERLDYSGAVLRPLDLGALDAIIDAIAASDAEAVAVCLLYSFVNPAHELAVLARVRERGFDWPVALSSEVLPEFREYERASATALEAYVRPVMSRYVGALERALPVPLRVMKSDGGVMAARRVQTQAIHTALSGPAAGVIGAYHLARLAGFERVITLDMGGTSTDVALCPGELARRPQSEIDGLPLRIRLLDIETVGAGGGSIARRDDGGALRVGPDSAGANPGPMLYGRGGHEVTVSDANAVLGRILPEHFLGGAMPLDLDAARAGIARLAEALGLTPKAAAAGVIEVADANIERAVRRVSVERGHDPREFTLVAFGGAGGLHACAVAERLGVRQIMIPRYPGVLCAFGLLVADVTVEYSRSVLGLIDDDTTARLDALLAEMLAAARLELAGEGVASVDMSFSPLVDMRYQGQAFELTLPYGRGIGRGAGRLLTAAFHAAHERTYGHALKNRPVEAVNLRLLAVGMTDKPALHREAVTEIDLVGTTFDRESLLPGAAFEGEAVVYQLDATTYIPAGWSARVDGYRNLILHRRAS